MAPGPDGDGAEAGSLTSATPGTSGRSPKTSISYSIEYASRRLKPKIGSAEPKWRPVGAPSAGVGPRLFSVGMGNRWCRGEGVSARVKLL